MRNICFSVPDSYDGVTLRGFLRSYAGLSSRLNAKLKRLQNGITRNKLPVKAPDILHSGDKVCLHFPEDEETVIPMPLPVGIIWEDNNIVICEKPSGMPMYPCPGHSCDSLENAIAYIQSKTGDTFAFRPVYRLDKDTTGLVMLAKNAYAASCLSGKVKKTYLAICEGKLSGSGIIDKPIGLKPGCTIQRSVIPDGDRAITRWRVLCASEHCSLVAVHLQTGRTHQIRVHFSDFGHPLAGDDMYGGSCREISRQALHCTEIRFRHPVTKKMIRICSKLPEDMFVLLKSNRMIKKQYLIIFHKFCDN